MEGNHGSDGQQPDHHAKCMRVGFVSKNNFRHLTLEPMCDHEADMNNDETGKDDQSDKVETARCLAAA